MFARPIVTLTDPATRAPFRLWVIELTHEYCVRGDGKELQKSSGKIYWFTLRESECPK